MSSALVINRWQTPEDAREAGWDTLVGPEDFFLLPDWMRVLQDSAGARMGYLTARADSRVLAALPMVHATRESPWSLGRTDLLIRHCAGEGMDGAAAILGAFGEVERLMPSMMCGGRHLGRTRLLLGPGADADTAHRILEEAEGIAAREGARSICLPYVDAADRVQRGVLRARGYVSHVSGQFASLVLPGDGFADYASAFPARRARRVRAERRRIEASGVHIALGPLDPADIPRLASLETELFAKYGMAGWDPRRSEAVLRAAAQRLGDRALVSKAVQEGRIVGFALILSHSDAWFAHRAGFDYAAVGKLPLYYELLYYSLADHAARYGVGTIHYGIGSTEAKVSRGCTLSEQYLYVKELA
ncbi:GNAT family N-acetyltransferase [Streptomyces sp. C11-1]|uniref:GNAT family N-acetyltransferase n=1 Tax=Streptomyces durocortorensis TaxID=2811104 RepID=A0ABY9W3M3_9ACTN|nr:GNAT family N-acetyltransferase [Streptomyces durocortorensis]WNF30747.1 GNAT family N-acetyltransferase [Streptomyces durocortorensis]